MKATEPVLAMSISCREDALILVLRGERDVIAIPWGRCSSRLADASAADRFRCELSPGGYGIHWPTLDEDLSIGGLLARASA